MSKIILSPQQLALFRDLGEKYPVGPNRRLKRRHYKVVRDWNHVYGRTAPTSVVAETTPDSVCDPARRAWYGYDPVDLLALGISDLETAKYAARSCMREGESIMTCNRRGKLAYSRIEEATKHVKKTGTAGIWSVSTPHAMSGNLWGYTRIWGENAAAVEAMARLIGPMTGLDPNWPLSIRFERLGTREEAMKDLMDQVTRPVNGLKADLARYQEHARILEKKIEKESERLSALMGGIMLLNGTDEDSENKEAAQ